MKRLYRSSSDKKLAGIFGGLSEILNIDSSLLRLFFVFLVLASGFLPLIILYFAAWIIIPEKIFHLNKSNLTQ